MSACTIRTSVKCLKNKDLKLKNKLLFGLSDFPAGLSFTRLKSIDFYFVYLVKFFHSYSLVFCEPMGFLMFKKEGSHEMLDKKTDILLAARKLFRKRILRRFPCRRSQKNVRCQKLRYISCSNLKKICFWSCCHLTRSKWWPQPQDFRKIPHLHRRSV